MMSPEGRVRVNGYHKTWAHNHHHNAWAGKSVADHKAHGHTIRFTIAELTALAKETTHCPICNVELKWQRGGLKLNSPSLDRRDNGDILTKDNVWIICHQCNATKGSRSLSQFVDYCKQVVAQFNGEEK
jgi:hypothetical protein